MMSDDANKTPRAYAREPIRVIDDIPIFSAFDRYVTNYQQIATDHVEKIKPGHSNPFIEEGLWKDMEDSTRELIRKHVPRGSRLLDVGVGLGRLLEPLTEYERYGIDISLDYLRIAKDKGINVTFSKIEDMPFRDGYFDAITCCDVLEHVVDLVYCSQRIVDVLRPGGILIVRVPDREDLAVYLRDDLEYELIHLRAFDVPSLRLNFDKIMGLDFVEANTAAPYLQGSARLKLRLLPDDAKQEVSRLVALHPELETLGRAAEISLEEFERWIYRLRDEHPDIFKAIAPTVLLGMECHAVFAKAGRGSLVAGTPRRSLPCDDSTSSAPCDYGMLNRLAADVQLLRRRVDSQLSNIDRSHRSLDARVSETESLLAKPVLIFLRGLSEAACKVRGVFRKRG